MAQIEIRLFTDDGSQYHIARTIPSRETYQSLPLEHGGDEQQRREPPMEEAS